MPLVEINAIVQAGVQDPYLDIMVSREVILDITEVQEVIHIIVREQQREGHIVEPEEVHEATNLPHALHLEVTPTVGHGRVLPEAVDTAGPDRALPEVADTDPPHQGVQEATAEVQEVLEVMEEVQEVQEASVEVQVVVLEAALPVEEAEGGTKIQNQLTKNTQK